MHGDYQFANVMYQHGAPAQLAAIVDWEMGTVGDPKLDLGWMVQSWPESSDEPTEMSYVDMRGMPTRDQVVEHYAKVSGRQVDDLDYYLVLAKWKLAIVLEQGFQRAGDDEKLLAFGPVDRPDALGRRTRRVHRLRGDRAPRSARTTDRRRWSASRSWPPPTPEAGQVRVRVEAAAVNFPDVLLIANQYQVSVPPPFVPGSEFAGIVVETIGRGRRFRGRRPGDRNRDVRRIRRTGGRIRAGRLARIPDGVDDRTAAAFGVAHRTAYHTLRSMARVTPGDDSSCSARAAASGLAAVQLGRRTGRQRHGGRVVDRKAGRGSQLRRMRS